MKLLVNLTLCLAAITIAISSKAEELPTISDSAQRLKYEDLDGNSFTPLACKPDQKASVLIFTTVDCPIANAYQPAIGRLWKKYSEAGVSVVLIQVDPDVDREAAKAHATEYKIPLPVILDPEHKLVDVTGATITPEAVVITPEAEIVYRGRIDDWYSDLGERRRAPRTSELSDAIDAVLKGEKPETQVTSAIGCFIADFRRPAEK